jgi:hypothetical protein
VAEVAFALVVNLHQPGWNLEGLLFGGAAKIRPKGPVGLSPKPPDH